MASEAAPVERSTLSRTLVLDRKLPPLSPDSAKEILSECRLNCGFEAFRPFLRKRNATVVYPNSPVDPDGADGVIDAMGFAGSLLMAYRLHGIAVMSPHDWWNAIAQCVSRQILLEHSRGRSADAGPQPGAEELAADVARCGDLLPWLRQLVRSLQNANPDAGTRVPQLLCRRYTTSSVATDIANHCAAVCAYKPRFVSPDLQKQQPQQYLCGLYAVRMQGSLTDWQTLLENFDLLAAYLEESGEDYGIEAPWIANVRSILQLLIVSFECRGRQRRVQQFWQSMVAGDDCGCASDRPLHGWLAFLLSCRVVQPAADLTAIPADFSVSVLPFTAVVAGEESNYQLCSGAIGYTLTKDLDIGRWLVQPLHEFAVFTC